MSKLFSLIIFILFSSSLLLSQNDVVLKELKALNEHYSNLKAYSMNISISYINNSGESIMNQTGSVLHSDKIHYMEYAGNKTLLREKYYISVNTEQQTLVFNHSEEKQKSRNNEPLLNISDQLDSLWKNQKNLDYRIIQSPTGTLRVFVEDSSNEFYSAYEILVDTKRHHLIDVIYYFRSETQSQDLQQIKITYSDHSDNPTFNQKRLMVDQYVSKKNGVYIPSEQYKNYLFIDQTKL